MVQVYTKEELQGGISSLSFLNTKGNFIISSFDKTHPRSLACMQSMAECNNICLGRVYHYHELTSQTVPKYLMNICCFDENNVIFLNKFEEALYSIVSGISNKYYKYSIILVPELDQWVPKEYYGVITDLITRYFKNLQDIKVIYYHA